MAEQLRTGVASDPPIGTAEFPAQEDDSEFGLPEGFVDPTQYRGKAPACEPNIGVGCNF
jgi:hypothetical protein